MKASGEVDPDVLMDEMEQAWGIQFEPGYDESLSYMAHLWQPVRCHYR